MYHELLAVGDGLAVGGKLRGDGFQLTVHLADLVPELAGFVRVVSGSGRGCDGVWLEADAAGAVG